MDFLKDEIKDIILRNKNTIAAMVLMAFGLTVFAHNMGCNYFLEYQGVNVTVYGNCKQLKIINDLDHHPHQVSASKLIEYLNTTTTITLTTSTTTITCPPCEPSLCPECPERRCTCPICHECPEPQCDCLELNDKVISDALNWHPHSGVTAYQAGAMDAKDYYLHLFEVPGRPKFKSRPSMGVGDFYRGSRIPKNETEYCFKNLGNYFYVNRTPDQNGRKRWNWDDAGCKRSWLRVNHL